MRPSEKSGDYTAKHPAALFRNVIPAQAGTACTSGGLLRVHLKSIGHTIVGDELYGKGLDIEKGIKRQFLHAYKVKFTHPVKKEEMKIEIPIFNDMKEFLER